MTVTDLGSSRAHKDETRKGNFIYTYTGTMFYPMDPHADEVLIEDIGHALSQCCRFTGHTSSFYSVAEHSVRMAKEAKREGMDLQLQFVALMHDASEAYIVDVPRPLKMEPYFGALYKKMEEGVMNVIAQKFNFAWPMPAEIKMLDNRLLNTEQRDLLSPEANSTGIWFPEDGIISRKLITWGPKKAKQQFFDTFDMLYPYV